MPSGSAGLELPQKVQLAGRDQMAEKSQFSDKRRPAHLKRSCLGMSAHGETGLALREPEGGLAFLITDA